MNYKTRSNYLVPACFLKCENRDIKCKECYVIQGKPTLLKRPKETKDGKATRKRKSHV